MATNWEYLGNIRGPQGYSVETASIDFDDHLRLLLSSGTVIDTGVARGPQGLPGVNAVDNDAAVAGYIGTAGTSATKTVLDKKYRRGFSVTEFGATGDGTTNDTAAVDAAISAANGKEVYFPAGTYVLDALVLTDVARLVLDREATLLHKASAVASMMNFTGTSLKITGGTIDGNKANQPNRTYIISGAVQTGKAIEIEGVHFTGTVASCVYVQTFGGLVSMQNCRVTEQEEHDGILGHYTTIMYFSGGQQAQKGLVRFNHNTCIGTEAPALAGGNPGGIFIASNGYVAGSPGSAGFADGNLSTVEAIGNYFWGYGQNCGGNDISPIHTYPAIGGARVIGNYFERCGFTAITAKSVQNFVCIGNVILNGIYSAQNVSTEGAIGYLPGYQAASIQRPRAVIANNIIDTPGGTSTTSKQYGISVHGTATSHATDVTITGNVITGAGLGIHLDYVDDATIAGNTIKGAIGGTADAEHGIRFDNTYGTVLIDGNRIKTQNGSALYALGKVSAAKFILEGNILATTDTTVYACMLRGAGVAKFTGNSFDGAALALSVAGDGTNNTGDFWWELSNSVLSGTASINYAQITAAHGHLKFSNAPEGVVAAELGTLLTATSGLLYVKQTGSGNTGWVAK